MPDTALEIAQAARRAARTLASGTEADRNHALHSMADAVAEAREDLLAANARDLAAAGKNGLSAATISRLTLGESKLREMVEGIRSVAALADPLGRVLQATELDDANPAFLNPRETRAASTEVRESGPGAPKVASDTDMGAPGPDSYTGTDAGAPGPASVTRVPTDACAGLHLQKISVPLGVLLAIFEARPDAVTQIAALAVKSGNAVILKPGREVEHTAAALGRVLEQALAARGLPTHAVTIVQGREMTDELLALHREIDLVIPRGGRELVEHVQAHTRIPVLGHAEGVCHIYVDRAADAELALRVIEDAKTDYPAACNAVETVLVHRDLAGMFMPRLARRLQARGVRLYGDAAVCVLVPQAEAVADWHTEYGDLAISVAVVDSTDAAIAHIHAHGSLHTESILTEDADTAERFLREVDAAGVFHNCSTRFADGFRYGFGAEVGISTSKLHARGPVGLEGLTTYKYLLRGHGHVAGDYRGPDPRAFTHKPERGTV